MFQKRQLWKSSDRQEDPELLFRATGSARRQRQRIGPPAVFEAMEPRLLLTASLVDDGLGSIVYTGGAGVASVLTVSQVASARYQFNDTAETITVSGAGAANWTGSGTNTVQHNGVGMTREFAVNLGDVGDSITIDDLVATDLLVINVSLGATDLVGDLVTLHGSTGPDDISLAATDSVVEITGLAVRVRISDAALIDGDALVVNGNDGDDWIKASTGVEDHLLITLNGEDDDDYLSADAVLNGGPGNDILVSGLGDDTISGGDGVDRVVSEAYGDTSRDFTFTLTDTQLTRTVGLTTDTDTLSGIEEAQLTGGDGDDSFEIGEFSGHVDMTGGLGSDTVDFLGGTMGVVIDLDLVDETQHLNAAGQTLILRDAIENFVGTTSVDRIYVDALAVDRFINSECSDNDLLTVDGQRQFVDARKSDRAGYVTAYGFGTIDFDGVERLAIVNTLGSIGFTPGGGCCNDAYTVSVEYPVADTMKRPRAVVVDDLNNDGHLDLVVVGKGKKGTNNTNVFLGEGFAYSDGTFTPPNF